MRRREHLPEQELALHASGDLNLWRSVCVRWHLSSCSLCRERVGQYRQDLLELDRLATELPAGMNWDGVYWDKLAVEMTANIRVGLAAGECVAPKLERRLHSTPWRVAFASLGLAVLLLAGWLLNTPKAQTASLGRAMRAIANNSWRTRSAENPGPIVSVSATGIELREGGSRLDVSQRDVRPVAVSLSVKGSARARYVDSETGQVTITSVYAQ
jgi:hypothetical protein